MTSCFGKASGTNLYPGRVVSSAKGCPELFWRIRTKIYLLAVRQVQYAMAGSDLGGARRLG